APAWILRSLHWKVSGEWLTKCRLPADCWSDRLQAMLIPSSPWRHSANTTQVSPRISNRYGPSPGLWIRGLPLVSEFLFQDNWLSSGPKSWSPTDESTLLGPMRIIWIGAWRRLRGQLTAWQKLSTASEIWRSISLRLRSPCRVAAVFFIRARLHRHSEPMSLLSEI